MENGGRLLEEGLEKLGIGKSVMGNAANLLARYIDEIELFNPAYGLVKVRDRRELIVKHILDSLAPLHIIRRLLADPMSPPETKPNIADVGSGAGLPEYLWLFVCPMRNLPLLNAWEEERDFFVMFWLFWVLQM